MMVVLAIILVLALWFVAKALSKLDAARSEAEETKRITEENYRLLTDNSVSAIASHEVVVDAAGEPVDYIFLSVNPAFESQTGLRGADIIGRRVTEVIPEAKNSPLIKTYGKVALTGEPAQLEYYAPEFDKYFAIKAYSLGQGRFATSFADISERKKAEEIIREKEALLSQMLEVMPIPVFYKDTSGRYVFVNKACENMFWRKREELIGKTVFDVNPPELAKIYYEDDMKLFTGGGTSAYYSQLQDSQGVLHDVIFQKAAIVDKDGKVTGLIGAILNLTDQNRLEEELKEVKHKLEDALERADALGKKMKAAKKKTAPEA